MKMNNNKFIDMILPSKTGLQVDYLALFLYS